MMDLHLRSSASLLREREQYDEQVRLLNEEIRQINRELYRREQIVRGEPKDAPHD